MCTVCGCGQDETRTENREGRDRGVAGDHHHHHDHDAQHHHYGLGTAGAHAPGLSQARMVQIEQDILAKNDGYAARNRDFLEARGILALNLVSSPGSGKTSLLVRTIQDLEGGVDLSVIEGDQQTSNDAARIRAAGARAVQVNTGKGCHLDAHMVGHALESLDPKEGGLLLIENVGNLVCPAAFDLGEAHKVVILSVTEGEDKPLKYPDMFRAADLMLLSKVDLLPHLDFDVARCLAYAERVNPRIRMIEVSAKNGQGLADWYAWIETAHRLARAGRSPLTAAE
ncbi:MAG: hydrogenase nickel incorporation protein HypB [Kiloniellales bacterium]|nr:hydrogenase nickel incorporation protein HypB [Kiloniellales bacterium]